MNPPKIAKDLLFCVSGKIFPLLVTLFVIIFGEILPL